MINLQELSESKPEFHLAWTIITEMFTSDTKYSYQYKYMFDTDMKQRNIEKIRFVRLEISKIYKVLEKVEGVLNHAIVVYFIYNNKYCRLAITESSIRARYLSKVKYDKRL